MARCWLDDISDDIVLAHPLKVKAIADAKIKTDKIDATVLAHLGEHEDLWGGLERRMSSPLNFEERSSLRQALADHNRISS